MATFADFPLDLAEVIIEFAAFRNRTSALDLSLVSHQVQKWSDKALFHTITIGHRREPGALNAAYRMLDHILGDFGSTRMLRARSLIRVFITRIYAIDDNKILHNLLTRCPSLRVLDLGFPMPAVTLQLHSPSLRRLKCAVTGAEDLASPLFQSVQQLHLSLDGPVQRALLRGLVSLKQIAVHAAHGSVRRNVSELSAQLPGSVNLVILLFMSAAEVQKDEAWEEMRAGKLDHRFIPCIPGSIFQQSISWVLIKDPLSSVTGLNDGGQSFWDRGNQLQRARKEGRELHSKDIKEYLYLG